MWRFLEGSRSQHGEITTEISTIRLYIWCMTPPLAYFITCASEQRPRVTEPFTKADMCSVGFFPSHTVEVKINCRFCHRSTVVLSRCCIYKTL